MVTQSPAPIDGPRLLVAVRTAFDTALAKGKGATDSNRARSQRWVSALANQFESLYTSEPSVRVLWKGSSKHRTEFGLNELLFDILVCQVDYVRAPRAHKRLPFITRGLWQVESELKEDGTAAVRDFSKLVLGSAAQKLFVGPFLAPGGGIFATLAAPAARCGDEVFVAQISHPRDWSKDHARDPVLYRYEGNHWTKIE